MTEQSRSGLRELQRLDDAIQALDDKMRHLDQQLAEVEEPALAMDSEVGTTRGRLQEMRVEERRVELAGEEKAARMKRLEERLNSVRNVREESAVTAEMDMVRRAREADEQEALSLLDQIRRLEDRLEEQTQALEEARSAIAPRRKELEEEKAAADQERTRLTKERDSFTKSLADVELRMYEAIRVGGRRALASLTEDGACGNCYSMVPPQVQNEIRHGTGLFRCEACGVILAAPLPEDAEEAEAPADEAPEAESDDGAADETAAASAGEDEVDTETATA